jgi:hypothetical protein
MLKVLMPNLSNINPVLKVADNQLLLPGCPVDLFCSDTRTCSFLIQFTRDKFGREIKKEV